MKTDTESHERMTQGRRERHDVKGQKCVEF